ncbi:RDD family protein [Massilicoli timonensis]|uniref:RDD family protein n=1 Tax=Massilicoli timonensis TaxID=2015901 RepID=UPI00307A6416
METVNGKRYSHFQLFKIFFKQRSRSYEKERHIRKADYSDMIYRVIALLADTVILLSPMYLWMVLFLLVCGDLLPVDALKYGNYVILGLMILTFALVQPYFASVTYGQSLGKYMCRFKVVGMNGAQVSTKVLFVRELLRDLPILLLQIFVGALPTFIYLGLNFLMMLLDPKHRILPDLITKTRVVVLLSGKKAKVNALETHAAEVMPKRGQIDLQIYSDFSAYGALSVEEIFQLAKKQGMRYISITDHNCAKANVIARQMSELYHVGYISGIEIDCNYKGKEVSVYGYHIDERKEAFKKIENDYLSREQTASKKRVALFEEISGMKIPTQELLKQNRFHTITPQMIGAYVLKQEAYRESALLYPYVYGDHRHDPLRYFEKDFFYKGKPCYVERTLPDLRVIVEVLHRCGGVAILAEPLWHEEDLSFIRSCLSAGLDGIQVFSSMHTKAQCAQLMKLAKEEKCLVSSGSGFMGIHRGVSLGECGCPQEAEKVMTKLIQYRQGN